ncbi:MAG: Tim44 domain-containing protein [Alphaproteobacteria bacterium]|nr:Tim44 domain-containing protein [Alphaproteobacteria bacterium]
MPADLIIYAVVAAGLVFWLRNILGTRHGEERERPNPFANPLSRDGKKPLPEDEGASESDGMGLVGDWIKTLDRNMVVAESAHAGLMAIGGADRAFVLKEFLRGAQDAFAMIVDGFAKGERETLKNLLAPPVYQAFESAIAQRETRGDTAETEIHAIRKTEILEARLEGKTAFVTIRFVADETNVLRDKDGDVISGNPDRITETIDIWTFSRDVKSRNPAWYLTETRDADAADRDHKTVPDSTKK